MKPHIFNNSSGKEFRDFVFYVLSKGNKSCLMDYNAVMTTSTKMITESFNIHSLKNENVRKPAIHMVLSFGMTEQISTEKVRKFLKGMNWINTQYIVVRHYDVPNNPHCHIVLNMVNLEGVRLNDSFSRKKALMVCRRISSTNIVNPLNLNNYLQNAIAAECESVDNLKKNLQMEFIESTLNEDGTITFYENGNRKNKIIINRQDLFLIKKKKKEDISHKITPIRHLSI